MDTDRLILLGSIEYNGRLILIDSRLCDCIRVGSIQDLMMMSTWELLRKLEIVIVLPNRTSRWKNVGSSGDDTSGCNGSSICCIYGRFVGLVILIMEVDLFGIEAEDAVCLVC
jgi:hypothetical protein